MGLINGGVPHMLDWSDRIDSWGHATLAGLGQWDCFMGGCRGGMRHWLDRGDGIDSWRRATLAGVGRWDRFMGACHGGTRHWLDRGMGLIYGGVRHRLDRGDGIDLWGCIMGVHDWIGVMGLICGDVPWGSATLAGSGQWDWFMGACNTGWIGAMGLIHGGTRHWLDRGDGSMIYGGARHLLDRGDGIDWWGCAMGIRDTETGRWHWFMGMRYGGAQPDRDWFVVAHHGGATLAGSGRWDWFMGAHHGGARHWLDLGNGIDSWGRAEWQSTIWLLNSNDDTMCSNIWRWGKCTECVWLRGW